MTASPRKILLIDDDQLQCRLTQAHFKKFSQETFALDWAETYEDGLARLLGGDYAACLLDFQLGERNGLQLIGEAMAAGCHTPIVFLTAETAERVDIEAMKAGALDYLVKGEITSRMLERSLRYALNLGETLDALRRLATRDELTGLLNRREFERILAEESDRALRFGRPVALVLVDIDHFKRINDTHGHPVGDEVLRQVAQRLSEQARSVDRVLRYGGEEFALLVMETDQAAALDVAQRICETVKRAPIAAGDGVNLSVTVSAGVAVIPGDATSGTALLASADKALYTAKARGRDCAVAAG